MRNLALLPLLFISAPASARKKPTDQPVVQSVPSIDEVVAKEGFVPTPSQSERSVRSSRRRSVGSACRRQRSGCLRRGRCRFLCRRAWSPSRPPVD